MGDYERDPAICGACECGYFRCGVYRDEWGPLVNGFSDVASLNVTWRSLQLDSPPDTTTGWYTKSFPQEETIEMIITERGSSLAGLPVGTYVRTDALGLTIDPVCAGDEIKKDSRYYEVEAVREKYAVGGDSLAYRECDLTFLPFKNLTGAGYTTSSVEDTRYRNKDYLETYLRTTYLPIFIVAYGEPDYPITRVFKTKGIDLVYSVGIPNSSPELGHDLYPYSYKEHVPIEVSCIDKSNIDGTKLLWNAVQELRYVTNNYPEGSQRSLREMAPTTQRLGSTVLHSQKCVLEYSRGLT